MPRAGRGAGSARGRWGWRGGPALGVPTRRCALGDCGCPGARESRCVTGADAPARLEAPGLPLTHQKALPRGPGGGKPGGLGGPGGGSGPGRRPARSSEALRAGKPQGGVCGSGSAGVGAAEGSGDHWQAAGVTCGAGRRRATAGRNKPPHRRHWAGSLRDPLPFRDLAVRRGTPGRVGSRSRRSRGTSAGPRLPPEVAGFQPPTLFKTSGGGCLWEETAPACRPPRPRLPPRSLDPPLPRGSRSGAGDTTCWVKAWPRLFPVFAG